MNASENSVLIAGTGALACLFAARLSAAGVGVNMLGTWQQGLEALRQRGVIRVDDRGQEKAFPVQVTNSPQDLPPVRLALVLVKSWQTNRVAQQLAACLAEDGLALTLQNGLGNRETLAHHLGEARVALGVTTTGATLLAPGKVRLAGEGTISLGEHPRLGDWVKTLELAGFETETTPDAVALLWGKLVINAAINPITALLEVPNGELLQRSSARSLSAAAARETAAIAVANGIRLPYPDAVSAVETVARRTASNHSSMLQDIHRGAPTEIDAINGAIVQSGEKLGWPVSINRTLFQLVKAKVES